jgi:small subunit ribosomal protein S20
MLSSPHLLDIRHLQAYASRLVSDNDFQPVWSISLPRIASAAKHLRKSRAAAIRNRAQRSTLRSALKKATTPEASAAEKKRAIQLLDRSARKGLIHRNAAARYKGRLDVSLKK